MTINSNFQDHLTPRLASIFQRKKPKSHSLFSTQYCLLFSGENPEYWSKFSIQNHQASALSVIDAQQQVTVSRVLVVDSDNSWDIILGQAQACPPYVCISLPYISVMDTLPKTLVVVHFTAEWCAPSKYMAGFFENLALKYRDILFLLVDVDEVKGVKDKIDVKAMPTFVLMKDNVHVDKTVGANADELQKKITAFVQIVRQSAEVQV